MIQYGKKVVTIHFFENVQIRMEKWTQKCDFEGVFQETTSSESANENFQELSFGRFLTRITLII